MQNNKVTVKRAVIIAAGFGSRLVPITLKRPKPLVVVNGIRIIDTLLDSFINIGIEEIYIIRGYKKEMFDELLIKYPNIKFIDNPFIIIKYYLIIKMYNVDLEIKLNLFIF